MALAVRNGWDPFTALVRQFDSDFDSLVRRAFAGSAPARTGFVPAADVTRDGNDVIVTLELAGVPAEDVDVEVADHTLRISGQRRDERSEDRDGVVIREIRSGSFRREFALPDHVTADAVEAEHADGLLRIRVRDVAAPKPEPRKVEVRGARAISAESERTE
ncbi:Hsp20/alpha crystallin family protein [Nocardia sp. CDC159]|uniref:Hsp20/alpha crystallin family protein n=1 Tax=Nocardia pulmonis TaxID=2951408 RepID=A0A9X2ECH7_9NOCA|nr:MULTISPECIES: Hsp20/alpha crystallin family protein [Nocardia]MCM6778304.1 Hsp20/alpha crystallin family protein [Nocardia pulmonis]MCM6791300.1 Hsp20/alpha crystallin family protein [Nocardia sp. CDC159]